ncbi:MAG: hypothetical protein U5K75_01460 [Ahrensia sp.]|nr:hypothetical protein [Ahrensia sp.]
MLGSTHDDCVDIDKEALSKVDTTFKKVSYLQKFTVTFRDPMDDYRAATCYSRREEGSDWRSNGI